jgi:hypothetical protein
LFPESFRILCVFWVFFSYQVHQGIYRSNPIPMLYSPL